MKNAEFEKIMREARQRDRYIRDAQERREPMTPTKAREKMEQYRKSHPFVLDTYRKSVSEHEAEIQRLLDSTVRAAWVSVAAAAVALFAAIFQVTS